MYKDLTPEQGELARYMSALSEEGWFSAWMEKLEYALWEAVLGTRDVYGRLTITNAQRERLLHLYRICGGWIVFDGEFEETWVPITEWEKLFSARQ